MRPIRVIAGISPMISRGARLASVHGVTFTGGVARGRGIHSSPRRSFCSRSVGSIHTASRTVSATIDGSVLVPSQKCLSSLIFGSFTRQPSHVQPPRCQILRPSQKLIGILHIVEFFCHFSNFSLAQVGREFVRVELEHGGAIGFFDFSFGGSCGKGEDCVGGEGWVATFIEEGGHVSTVLAKCGSVGIGEVMDRWKPFVGSAGRDR